MSRVDSPRVTAFILRSLASLPIKRWEGYFITFTLTNLILPKSSCLSRISHFPKLFHHYSHISIGFEGFWGRSRFSESDRSLMVWGGFGTQITQIRKVVLRSEISDRYVLAIVRLSPARDSGFTHSILQESLTGRFRIHSLLTQDSLLPNSGVTAIVFRSHSRPLHFRQTAAA